MILKPLKWLILTGAVVGGAGFLFFGTDFPSYVGTVASSVKEGVTGSIPVEFELKRAEGLIRKIEPQIESCKRDVARAEVELEELQTSVVGLEKTVIKEESALKSGARLLSGDGVSEVVLASDSRSRRRVESSLQRTMDSFKTNSSILKTKRALIERQTQAVEVAKQRFFAVRAEKDALEDQCRQLKTQQQQIEQMAASSKHFHLDDSALGAAREVIAQVKKRLDVAQKMLENEMVYQGDDVLAAGEPTRDVLKEIEEQFGTATAAVVEMPVTR